MFGMEVGVPQSALFINFSEMILGSIYYLDGLGFFRPCYRPFNGLPIDGLRSHSLNDLVRPTSF